MTFFNCNVMFTNDFLARHFQVANQANIKYRIRWWFNIKLHECGDASPIIWLEMRMKQLLYSWRIVHTDAIVMRRRKQPGS